MLIGFAGDVHGLVYHAIALVTTWQRKTGKKLDFVIQVGDMGAYPSLDRIDEAGRRHIEIDPAQADFSRLLKADGLRAEGSSHTALALRWSDSRQRPPGEGLPCLTGQ